MNNDQLVNLLTLGAIPLIGLLLGLAYKLMDRADKNRDKEAAEEKEQLAADRLNYRRYLELRERFTKMRDRAIRRLELTLTRLSNGQNAEAVKGIEQAIAELEAVELPPLE